MHMTLAAAMDRTGVAVHDYLDFTAEVPRVSLVAAQGDVLLLRVTTKPATTPMPRTVVAVASEASSNTHTLHPSGECYWDAHTSTDPGDVLLGIMTITDGATALLIHQEHGALEILPGTYQVRRQREFAGEWRAVCD